MLQHAGNHKDTSIARLCADYIVAADAGEGAEALQGVRTIPANATNSTKASAQTDAGHPLPSYLTGLVTERKSELRNAFIGAFARDPSAAKRANVRSA